MKKNSHQSHYEMVKPPSEIESYLDVVAAELYHQLRLIHLTDPAEFDAIYQMRMLAAYYQTAARTPERIIGRFTIIDVPKNATTQDIKEVIEWMKTQKKKSASFIEWETRT